MKSFFDKLFNRAPEFSYTIAAYQPVSVKTYKAKSSDSSLDYEATGAEEKDEMQIDKIYQSN